LTGYRLDVLVVHEHTTYIHRPQSAAIVASRPPQFDFDMIQNPLVHRFAHLRDDRLHH
jgi:hypothetical protein